VFTYKHLREKRLKRAEETAAQEAKAEAKAKAKAKAKGKRGQQGESATQEPAEATAPISIVRRGRKRKSTAQ
jgi:hypothetical protein